MREGAIDELDEVDADQTEDENAEAGRCDANRRSGAPEERGAGGLSAGAGGGLSSSRPVSSVSRIRGRNRSCSSSVSTVICPSPPLWGEREGPAPKAWEGEVGIGGACPSAPLTLPSPPGRRGEREEEA